MTDIMARIARNEPMTAGEQEVYTRVMALCSGEQVVDGLFVLIEAINRKATMRGLTLSLTLRRPKRPRGQRMPIGKFNDTFHDTLKGIWPSVYGLPPKEPEREMGFIEGALRKNLIVMSSPVRRVYAGARAELRRRGMKEPENIDISSEAIEAAEALGL